MKSIIPDLFILCGIGSISYGSYLVFKPAGFIVAGLLVVALGVAMARKKGN